MKPENINHPVLKYIIEEDIAKDDYYALVSEYQQMILLYESAVKQLITKFEIFNQEYKMRGARNPIETVKSRVKGPESIVRKMKKYGFEKSLESIVLNLNDVAGVRVICSYVSDIYLVRDMLLAQKDVTLVEERDYIKSPKENGYRSLHLIIELPVYLTRTISRVKAEIQIRTIAMDFWASLEHNIRYKAVDAFPPGVVKELRDCAEIIAVTDRRMEALAHKLHQGLQ